VVANTVTLQRHGASLLDNSFGVGFSWIVLLAWNAFFIASE